MIRKTSIAFLLILLSFNLAQATDADDIVCEGYVQNGQYTILHEMAYSSYSGSSSQNYIKEFRRFKGEKLSDKENEHLSSIEEMVHDIPENQKTFFAGSFLPANGSEKLPEWEPLVPTLKLALNKDAQHTYLKKPKTNLKDLLSDLSVTFMLGELSFVKESQEGTGMGQIMHNCYCYAYHLDTSGKLHCVYK